MSTTQPSRDDAPTAKQLRLLRSLASERGQSFTYPATKGQASAEIRRLRGERRLTDVDREVERKDLTRVQPPDDASRVRNHEITGYGSNCQWSH